MKTLRLFTIALLVTWAAAAPAQKISEVMRPKPQTLVPSISMTPKAKARREMLRKEKLEHLIDTTCQKHVATIKMERLYVANIVGASCPLVKAYDGQSYTLLNPTIKVFNSTFGRDKIRKSTKLIKYNPAKDLMTDIMLKEDSFYIYNKSRMMCDMSEFEFTPRDTAIRMDGNRISLSASAVDFAQGRVSCKNTIDVRHIPSGNKAKIRILIGFADSYKCHSQTTTLVLAPLPNGQMDKYARLYDIQTQTVRVVSLPVSIDAQGLDGRNGSNGANGMNGTNQISITDKDGKVTTFPGTCGTAGSDGGNGESGGDGGTILLCCSKQLFARYGVDVYSVDVSAGEGGRGGRGGRGGTHGTGGPCFGRAMDGRPGEDGKDGKEGEYLTVVTDTYLVENTKMERIEP